MESKEKYCTSLDTVTEQLEDGNDRITCKICSELTVSPRSLRTCGHCFCEECILTYVKKLEQENELKASFPCPACEEPQPYSEREITMTWIRQLPKPFNMNEPTNEPTDKELGVCSPCNSTGESQPAARYCIDCDELLCKTCVDCHMKFKPTKHHILVHCHKDDKFKGAKLLSSLLVCPNHKDRPAEVKCEIHNTLCCLTCATIIHRNCQAVSEIRELAAGCKAKQQTDTLFIRIEGVRASLEEIASANDTRIREFKASCDEIPQTLEQIKADLMKLYDRIEVYVVDKIKELDESFITEISKENWNNKLAANADLMTMLNTILEVGTNSQAYVTIHKIKEKVEEQEKDLSDQGCFAMGQRLQLNVIEKLERILNSESVQSLVDIERVQTQHQLPKTSVFSKRSIPEETNSTSDSLQEKSPEKNRYMNINESSADCTSSGMSGGQQSAISELVDEKIMYLEKTEIPYEQLSPVCGLSNSADDLLESLESTDVRTRFDELNYDYMNGYISTRTWEELDLKLAEEEKWKVTPSSESFASASEKIPQRFAFSSSSLSELETERKFDYHPYKEDKIADTSNISETKVRSNAGKSSSVSRWLR